MARAPERMLLSLLDEETTGEGADLEEKNRISDLDMLSYYSGPLCLYIRFVRFVDIYPC